jgi:protease I
MKKAVILTCTGFKDYEAIYPYYRLLEEGFEVDVIADTVPKVTGILGGSIPSNIPITNLSLDSAKKEFLENYDILILPGGVTSLEKLRLYKDAVSFVAGWNNRNKIIGSICSGAQMLISAKAINGRRISAYYSMEQDIWNAGATFIDAPAVVDENIISSPHYKWLGQWMKEVINVYNIKNK